MTGADLAREIWRARAEGRQLPREEVAHVAGEQAAYAVQAAAVACSGLTRIGWKVAATSDAALQLLAVPGPSIGPVFAELTRESPATVAVFAAQGPAVECEFAFRMARDLAAEDAPYDPDEVLDAVGAVVPAIEVVASRFEGGFKGVGEALTIADFCFNHGWVHGADIAGWRAHDLSVARIRLEKDGETVAEGVGANVLGDPLAALVFAADKAAEIGRPLMAGEIVSTGTCTGVTPVGPGSRVRADFGPLGLVEIAFTAA